MLLLTFLAMLTAAVLSQDTNVADLPQCAQNCLKNATSAQGSCANVDVKCLCTNTDYVNVLACCLDTTCSTADQQNALAFNMKLCSGVNVTIPNFLGCAVTSSSKSSGGSGSSGSKSGSSSGTSSMSGTTMTTAASATGIIEPLYTTATGAPVAQFTGRMLLVGSCSTPQFATVTMDNGLLLEYPWVGCSKQNPDCCPFNAANDGGPITICPADYFTTSSACCPSGWSVYTSAFAGQTPCYSTTSPGITGPSISIPNNAAVSAISTRLFTLRYALAPPPSAGLATGAKAGIAVGIVMLAIILTLALLLFIRRHRRQKQALLLQPPPWEQNPSTFAGSEVGSKRMSHPTIPLEFLSELPSPTAQKQPTEVVQWYSQSPVATSSSPLPPPLVQPSAPPGELPGDTFLNEHHPAYSPSVGGMPEVRPASTGNPMQVPPMAPEGVVSPMEEHEHLGRI